MNGHREGTASQLAEKRLYIVIPSKVGDLLFRKDYSLGGRGFSP
jgi:hypothetical protein